MELLSKQEETEINDYLESKGLPINVDVTFGDVTLTERYSDTRSRSEISDFRTRMAGDIYLDIPVASANMVCVTGTEMAVALQREGGMGFIPQMLTLEERLDMIDMIKRSDSAYIEEALTIKPDQTLKEAKDLMNRYKIFSLIVVNGKNQPIGVLSTRDWLYETDLSQKVKNLMGGGKKLITADVNVSFKKAEEILKKNKIEKLPLVDSKGRLSGLITSHGLFYKMHHPRATRDDKGQFLAAGSIGVGKTFTKQHLNEVSRQVEHGINVLLIDTARAYSINTQEALVQVRKHFPKLTIVAGNVSTPEGVKYLFKNGADAVKVNQGRGHACRTSEIGIGVPQITSIAKASVIAKKYGGTIFADGGMKSVGDMVKAIAAGADMLFTGFMLIGTKESAAQLYFNKAGLPVKNYEGSASTMAQAKRIIKGNLDKMRRPEGITEEVVVTGTVKEMIQDVVDGFKSALSYQGLHNLDELRKDTKFELQTRAGLFEGTKKAA